MTNWLLQQSHCRLLVGGCFFPVRENLDTLSAGVTIPHIHSLFSPLTASKTQNPSRTAKGLCEEARQPLQKPLTAFEIGHLKHSCLLPVVTDSLLQQLRCPQQLGDCFRFLRKGIYDRL